MVYHITFAAEGKKDPLFKDFTESFDVINWHYDMPGTPEKAVLLAKSDDCPNQAFRYGNRTYGLQFHMEISKEGMQIMRQNCPEDLKPSKYTQSEEQMMNQDYMPIHQRMHRVLD